MAVLGWVFSHKILVLFIAASAGLCISTIILGVNVTKLNNELQEEKAKSVTEEVITSTQITTTTEEPATDMSKYRLPSNVKPTLYDLYLYPDLKTGLFTGTVIVSIDIAEPTTTIVLHNNNLDITSVTVKGELANVEVEDKYEIIKITRKNGNNFTSSFDTLAIEFNGDMKNRIVGLYTSSYTSEGNTTLALYALAIAETRLCQDLFPLRLAFSKLIDDAARGNACPVIAISGSAMFTSLKNNELLPGVS